MELSETVGVSCDRLVEFVEDAAANTQDEQAAAQPEVPPPPLGPKAPPAPNS